MTLVYICLGIILLLVITNMVTGFLWLKGRLHEWVPRLSPAQDLKHTEGPAAFVFQFDAGSGFGDRIGYYLGACAVAKHYGMDVYAQWINPKEHDLGRSPLELVKYPACLHFDEPIPYQKLEHWVVVPFFRDMRFNLHAWGAGFDLVHEFQYLGWTSWSKNFRDSVTWEQYLEDWHAVASELQPNFDIQAPSEPFLSLHLRRGDKSHPNVPLVVEETKRIVGECLKEHKTWTIFSDDSSAAEEFAEFITSRGGKVLTLPEEPDKTRRMLIEFFWLVRSYGVVQSVGEQGRYGGFSAFSYIPAQISRLPLITCIPLEKVGKTRFQNYARVNRKRLENVFYNHEDQAFLERLRST